MFKSKVPEKDQPAVASTAEDALALPTIARETATPEAVTISGTICCIGAGMSIVGKIECDGPVQVFGRLEGELRASELLIGKGAQLEGSVIAQEVTVCGRVKGTIRGIHVKLQGGGEVEGDIFHRSLLIHENSIFEGSSRRVENPTDLSSSVGAISPQKKDPHSAALPAASPSILPNEANVQRH